MEVDTLTHVVIRIIVCLGIGNLPHCAQFPKLPMFKVRVIALSQPSISIVTTVKARFVLVVWNAYKM